MKALLTAYDYDYFLIAAVFIIMITGLAKRHAFWRTHVKDKFRKAEGDLTGLIRYLVWESDIRQRPWVGNAHLALFWGLLLPMAVIILAQFSFILPFMPARILSLLQDVAGLIMLIGTLFLLIRRVQSGDNQGPAKTVLPLLILLIILMTGFLAEGARLSILQPDGAASAWSSPVGWVFSLGLPSSPLLMQIMIRLHFFMVLIFIAAIPFTFMRHLAAVPLNIFYQKERAGASLRKIAPEKGEIGAKTVQDFTWKQLLDVEACVSCGRCEENCPASVSGKALSPRKVMRALFEDVEKANNNPLKHLRASRAPLLEKAISADEIWACTTCMACVAQCPVFTEPMDKIIDIRRYQVMGEGRAPEEAHPMIRDLELYGDVQGKGVAHRGDWALNRNVRRISDPNAQADILFWVGCSGAFHPRNQETARAMVKILQSADIRFGILAQEELCCGDPARRLGEETLFLKLARQNIDAFKRHNVKKIVTLCPHCMNTLKNEYPALDPNWGCNLEVVHAVEFVMELIRTKKIALKYPVADKIAVHDPCYLGRYNQVYQPPREICSSVPETELREPERNMVNGFCCGGGGGRMWLHESSGRNINLLRAEEIVKTKADLIGTACPYCQVMLDDGVKSLELENPPKVADIIDIVADSLG
ncbi:(Fe-S)-binding protein [Desulfococcaceae bacterium HSG7]|nr:(Fe-S)-binding protein [Desulfococcaceae bacterium HSG7]